MAPVIRARRPRKPKKTPAQQALDRALQDGIGYTTIGPDSYEVDSSDHMARYHVTGINDEWECNCQASRYCKHIALVQFRTGAFPRELRREALRLQEQEIAEWEAAVKALDERTDIPEAELPW